MRQKMKKITIMIKQLEYTKQMMHNAIAPNSVCTPSLLTVGWCREQRTP